MSESRKFQPHISPYAKKPHQLMGLLLWFFFVLLQQRKVAFALKLIAAVVYCTYIVHIGAYLLQFALKVSIPSAAQVI